MTTERQRQVETIVDTIRDLFERAGGSQYGGEVVTQGEHALQAAWLAEEAGADSCLIAAALLHDIGHMLHHLPDDAPDRGIDDRHEELGARWLQGRFPDEVTEPVRLHVPAKRYLAATDSDYLVRLSPPSVVSLKLQGGPMSLDEIREFERHPQFQAAIALRHWDDTAKVSGLRTPETSHFLTHVRAALDSIAT